jgi:hypothetical protein
MLSLQHQQHGADARHQARQTAALGGAGGGGVDWLGFAGRADLKAPVDAAASTSSFLLPPAPPLDNRAAAQPEPMTSKTGQLAGGDFELRVIALFCSKIVSWRRCLGILSLLRSTEFPLMFSFFVFIINLKMNSFWWVSNS